MRAIGQRIARNQVAKRCPRESGGLHALNKRGGLMMFLSPGGYVIPAQPIVDGDIWPNSPTVLCESAAICRTLVERWRGLLRIEIGKAEQKIGEAVSGGLRTTAKKRKRPIRHQIGVLFYLVPQILESKFEGVLAFDLGKGVGGVKCVVHLSHEERLGTGGEGVEVQGLNACKFWRALDNALASGGNSLLRQGGADASFGYAKIIVQASGAETGLVDQCRTK